MEAATLGIPVMACDVSGCHSFLKKYGGLLLEDYRSRTPAQACSYSLEGKVLPLNIDAERINHTSAAQVEALIAGDIHISPQN